MNLPSALSFLSSQEAKGATFLKPALGVQLADPFTAICGFAPNIMGVRILSLVGGTVVPVHIHKKKEKIYILLSLFSAPTVVVIVDGKPQEHKLEAGKPFCVPADYPHFVKYLLGTICQIVVVSSSQDGEDIIWEDDADKLIVNKK